MPELFSEEDRRFMMRAIELSLNGWPAPNPHVGCVIAKEGRIIAEGWHEHAGGPHAEAAALAVAGPEAEGSNVYVTLEPCSHFGRTPPCSAALIGSKVKKVIYAVPDPNPKAAGGGRALQQAGIQVHTGLLKEAAAEANLPWLASQLLGRPYVILKAAVTEDGFMARTDGTSKWITSADSRREGHKLRAAMGAVLVGWRTVQLDDPELTARIDGVINQPRAIILDPHGRLTGEERVLKREEALWLTGPGAASQGSRALSLVEGRFAINSLLAWLRSQAIMGVLVEGGAGVLDSFHSSGLWDELHLFIGSGRFHQGLSAPEEVLKAALEQHVSEPVSRTKEMGSSGKDRHIEIKNSPGAWGTIQEWLKSIPIS